MAVPTSPIVLVEALRTPLGAFQGSLSRLSAPELGSVSTCGILGMVPGARDLVDGVIMGCVLTAGLGQAPARQVVATSGLPLSTPATTVNKVCGSGMEALSLAHDALRLGRNKAIIAGGMESMSNAPLLVRRPAKGQPPQEGIYADHLFWDALENARDHRSMGALAEMLAETYGFTRDQQEEYVRTSLKNALQSSSSGGFAREIVPVLIQTPQGTVEVATDEFASRLKPEKIPFLRPAFKEGGTITAATSSGLSDGAASVLMTTESYAQSQGWKPRAFVRGVAGYALDPEWFTLAPVGAIKALMKQVGWSMNEIDLFEINEAFAVVPMAAMRDLGIPREKLNVQGGACILGHPVGASGARLVVTLLNALEQRQKTKGVAAICIGGGEALALALEI